MNLGESKVVGLPGLEAEYKMKSPATSAPLAVSAPFCQLEVRAMHFSRHGADSCFDASSENALSVGIGDQKRWNKTQHMPAQQPQPQNLKFSACTMDSRSQYVPKAQRSRSISSQQSAIKGDTGAHAVTSLGPASLRKSASP